MRGNKHALYDFTGQTHIVTGGASGIGEAIVRRLISVGAGVVIADRNIEAAEAVARSLSEGGAKVLAVAADVGSESDVEAMFAAGRELGDTLHGIAHCAGIGVERTILDTTLEDWNRLIGVNLTGTFLCARGAARIMAGQGYGRIVLMGSAAGERGGTGRTAYGATKGGVHALTRVLAVELAELGITVNAMSPGAIETELVKKMHDNETREADRSRIPANRYGTPDEVAAAALFLLSRDAGYVSGAVLPIDGGFAGSGVIKRRMNPAAS